MTCRLDAVLAELAAAIREEVDAAVERAVEYHAPDRMLSVAEAAKLLGVARSTAYTEILYGRLHSVKIGRRRLVPESAIARYFEAQAQ